MGMGPMHDRNTSKIYNDGNFLIIELFSIKIDYIWK